MNSEHANVSVNSRSTLGALPAEVVNYDSTQFESLIPGYRLGEFQNYRLLKCLGEGGMGQTWLAEELSGGEVIQKVVVKILSKELCGHEEALAEVRRIFTLTRQLRHPNICATFGMKKDPSFGWIHLMDYADGGTLWDWFRAQPNYENGLPLEKILPILRPIAEALDFAHHEGILHRDVKPQNIMFARKKPILIDFGIAARIRPENLTHSSKTFGRSATTHASSTSGTPVYMAPEQFLGLPQTGGTDQYALALVLYELLAGKLPFTGSIATMIFQKASFSPENPNFPATANSALRKALAIQPENRFPTCRAFIDALSDQTAQNSQPNPAPQSEPPRKVQTEVIRVPDDARTLAEAYERISERGQIIIRRGTYAVPETVVVRKSITIAGEGTNREKVVLKGKKSPVLHLESGFAEIKNLTFKNVGTGNQPDGSAVLVNSAMCSFESCLFTSKTGIGFTANQKDSDPIVTGCAAKNCGGSGFLVCNGAKGKFTDCESSGNALAGIWVEGSGTNPTVERCRFTDGKDAGIFVCDGAGGTFTDCDSIGNAKDGIWVDGNGTNPTVERCRFTDGKSVGIWVEDGACGTFTDCESSGNALPGIQVQGSGTNPKVKKCKFTDGKDVGIWVEDGASGTFTDCESSGNALAGLWVEGNGTNPTVERCRFTDGKSVGIWVEDGACGTFTDCESSGNALAGIMVQGSGTNPKAEKCKFTEGKDVGIFVLDGAIGTFTDCESSGNANSGIYVQGSGTNPDVAGCRIMNNREIGICVQNSGGGTFRNNTISGNASPWAFDSSCPIIREGNRPNH